MIKRVIHPLATLALLATIGGCKSGPLTCEDRGLETLIYYMDRDRDTHGDPAVFMEGCTDENPSVEGGDQWVEVRDDCDDLRPSVYPNAPELCDGLDNNCNNVVDDGLQQNRFWIDADSDTFGDPTLEVVACSVPTDAALRPGDCNDADGTINPMAVEICDGIDNDCDTLIDGEDDLPLLDGGVDVTTGLPWRPDTDDDGFGDWNEETEIYACTQPEGYVEDNTDCVDTDPVVNPSNTEICNGLDDDCDQLFDDSDDSLNTQTQQIWYRDADADGYGVPDESIQTCTAPWFYSLRSDDCDDANPAVVSAGDTTWGLDNDGDGFGAGEPSEPSCTPPDPTGWASLWPGIDCDDTDLDVFPDQLEICDGIDNDCDELIDDDDLWFEDGGVDVDSMSPWFIDADGDLYGDGQMGYLACQPDEGDVPDFTDCLDSDPAINPGAIEICDNIDNDCDFRVDDRDENLDLDSATVYTRDADGDGFGDLDVVIRSCVAPDGYTANFGDCDDADADIGLPSNWWFDADGDGNGAGEVVSPASCEPPGPMFVPWYVDFEEDCAPDDPFALSGPEICYDGIDQGCDDLDYVPNGTCEIQVPNTCVEALSFAPLLPGGQRIRDTLATAGSDLDLVPNAVCLDDRSAGQDDILPVLVPAGSTLTARLRISGGDGVIYLLSDCFVVSSCLASRDASTINGGFETLTWANTGANERTLYLVIDGYDPSDSRIYDLEINLTTP